MIVEKAVKMANMMNVPILGLVENMSYIKCPDCDKEIKIYGDSHVEEIAKEYSLDLIGRLPIDPLLAKQCDAGTIELFEGNWLDAAADKLETLSTTEE